MADPVTSYARSVYAAAEAEGMVDRVTNELTGFAAALEQHNELRNALTDIRLPQEQKDKVIDDLLSGRGAVPTRNIISFLVASGRVRDMGQIVTELQRLSAEADDKVLAEVRTAVALDDSTRASLAQALEKLAGRPVELRTVVDPDVIGGVYAKVGDKVIDGTIRRRLEVLASTVN